MKISHLLDQLYFVHLLFQLNKTESIISLSSFPIIWSFPHCITSHYNDKQSSSISQSLFQHFSSNINDNSTIAIHSTLIPSFTSLPNPNHFFSSTISSQSNEEKKYFHLWEHWKRIVIPKQHLNNHFLFFSNTLNMEKE